MELRTYYRLFTNFMSMNFNLIAFIFTIFGSVFYYVVLLLDNKHKKFLELQKSIQILEDFNEKQNILLLKQQESINSLQELLSQKLPVAYDLNNMKYYVLGVFCFSVLGFIAYSYLNGGHGDNSNSDASVSTVIVNSKEQLVSLQKDLVELTKSQINEFSVDFNQRCQNSYVSSEDKLNQVHASMLESIADARLSTFDQSSLLKLGQGVGRIMKTSMEPYIKDSLASLQTGIITSVNQFSEHVWTHSNEDISSKSDLVVQLMLKCDETNNKIELLKASYIDTSFSDSVAYEDNLKKVLLLNSKIDEECSISVETKRELCVLCKEVYYFLAP